MIKLTNVSKYFSGYEAIDGVSLTIEAGQIYGIIGASGAGKSTLLRLMNFLEIPDKGEVEVDGQQLTRLSHKQLREARKSIGMIFQHFNLLANKTCYDNIAISLELAGVPRHMRKERVMECLRFVGLENYINSYPAQLSGGQKQRVAIARALANKPKVLLCDEPTSALDPSTTAEILTVLRNINVTLGVTIVIVSHQMEVIKSICHTVTVMSEGRVYDTLSIQPKGIIAVDKSPESFIDELKEAGGKEYV